MEIKEMSLKEVENRQSEIRTILQGDLNAMATDALQKLNTEFDDLESRKAEINKAIEEREAILKKAMTHGKVVEKHETEPTMLENKINDVKSAEYREAYLLSLQGKATPEQRTAVSAAAVIPTLTLNKIYEKLEQDSVLYPYISKSSLPGTVSIPVENAKNEAAWVAMGTASTDGADSLSAVTLSLYKLIKTVELTADNVNASVDAFENFLVKALAKKIARAVDIAICTGDGSSKATGILASGVITNTGTYTKAGMTHADLMAIIADVGTEYRKGAIFAMPSAVYFSDVVAALAAKGIGPDAQNPLSFRIAGFPVVLDDNITADSVIFGNFEYYHWNWAKDVTIEADDSVGFRTGSRVYRAMGLADGKVVNKDAFTVYTRSAT